MAGILWRYGTLIQVVIIAILFGSALSWWWSDEDVREVPKAKPPPPSTPPPPSPKQKKQTEKENKRTQRTQTVSIRLKQLGIDPSKFNVVIVGTPGTGKSAGVNALIGKKSGETGAATEGASGETTLQLSVYGNSVLHPNISVWDIPGGSTGLFKTEDYIDQWALDLFDLILFFTYKDTASRLDVNIIDLASQYEVPLVVIHPMSNIGIDELYKKTVADRYTSSKNIENFDGKLDNTLFASVKENYYKNVVKDYLKRLERSWESLRKETDSSKFVPIRQMVISTRTLRGDKEFAKYELDESQLRDHILRLCGPKCKRDEKQMKLEESNRYNERKQSASNRRRQIGIDENKFNVVIAGATGVGKSSGVNALIGKVSGEKDSAEESDTGETTMDLRVFNNAKIHSNITVWDIPGGATTMFPFATYFEHFALDLFDLIMFFVAPDGAPNDLDVYVIDSANKHDVPIIIIHPMSNVHIDARYKKTVAARYTLSKTLADFDGAGQIDMSLLESVKQEYHKNVMKDYVKRLNNLRKLKASESDKYVPIRQFVISTRTLRGDAAYAIYELDEPQLRQYLLRQCDTMCKKLETNENARQSSSENDMSNKKDFTMKQSGEDAKNEKHVEKPIPTTSMKRKTFSLWIHTVAGKITTAINWIMRNTIPEFKWFAHTMDRWVPRVDKFAILSALISVLIGVMFHWMDFELSVIIKRCFFIALFSYAIIHLITSE